MFSLQMDQAANSRNSGRVTCRLIPICVRQPARSF